jgi:hypothetical protein
MQLRNSGALLVLAVAVLGVDRREVRAEGA